MSTRFDYTTFLNYYQDPRNVNQEPLPRPNVQFYDNNTGIPYDASLGNTSIVINHKKYFIRIKPQRHGMLADSITFTLPTVFQDASGLWDVHYHFGIRNIDIRNRSALSKRRVRRNQHPVVYFHKTSQEPHKNNKRHENCYFWLDEPIYDLTLIPDIDCLQTADSQMKRLNSEDVAVVGELIRRPFYGIHYGGRRKRNAMRTQRRTKTKGRGTRRARL
jgi:hypothetical protein